MAPALKPVIDSMGSPLFIIHLCYRRNCVEHHLRSCPMNQLTQSFEVLLNCAGALLVLLITANLENQHWAELGYRVSW